MTWTIRRFGAMTFTVLAAAAGAASSGRAQCPTPDCLYRFVVPYPAGGPVDSVTRIIGQSLEKRLGVHFVVESRVGARGRLAAEAVAAAKPDGFTLLVFDSSATIDTTLYASTGFNLLRDIAPVASVASEPSVMLASPSLGAKTVPELIAYAKTNPGKINVASAGIGTQSHLSAELFKQMVGVNIVHVPYRGSGAAIAGLAAGQVQLSFLPIGSAIAPIRERKIVALAVTSSMRSDLLPDIPTLAEAVPGYVARGWIGLGAPKNTPGEIVDKLNKEINATLTDSAIKAQLAKLGISVLVDSPAGFERLIESDTSKWANVIQAAKIRAE